MNQHRPHADPHSPRTGGQFRLSREQSSGDFTRPGRSLTERLRRLPPPLLLAGALASTILAVGLINQRELVLEQQTQQRLTRSVLEITNDFSRFLPLIAPPGARSGPLPFSAALPPAVAAQAVAPVKSAATSTPAIVSKTVAIGRGDTLMGVLTAAGVAANQAQGAVAALRTVFDPRELKLGQHITLTFSRMADELRLAALSMAPSRESTLAVHRVEGDTYTAETKALPLTPGTARTGGVIEGSLSATGRRLDVPPRIMAQMIHLFSYRVDFQRDVKSGDRFAVYYDRAVDPKGRTVKLGPLLYAEMTLSNGKPLRYYRCDPDRNGGAAEYYTPDGHSIRRALLRTPIDGARISSGFGMRVNPILGYSQEMHPGIDFAAPMGTPIMAAGEGTIEQVGWFHGYGKYIRIRHDSTFSTTYGHMSSFAKVHPGEHVHQGEVIGYVGSTGRSTGPHLYFEVIKNGVKVNPMSVSVPIGGVLKGRDFARFQQEVHTIDQRMAALSIPQPALRPTSEADSAQVAAAGK